MLLKSLFPTLRNNNYTFGFDELSDLHKKMDNIFEEMLIPFSESTTRSLSIAPDYDVADTEDHYLLRMDMPGVPKEKLKVEVRDNVLYIYGEREDEWKRDKNNPRGRYYGRFETALALPVGTNIDAVEANYEDGVLRIAIPKTEAAKPKQIKIAEGSKNSGFWSKLLPNKNTETKKLTETKVIETDKKVHA